MFFNFKNRNKYFLRVTLNQALMADTGHKRKFLNYTHLEINRGDKWTEDCLTERECHQGARALMAAQRGHLTLSGGQHQWGGGVSGGRWVENPKTNISVEWSDRYQVLGPVALFVPGHGYFANQSQLFWGCPFPQSWCPPLVPSLTVSHALAWHSIFRPFPGIYLEPISCAAQRRQGHDEIREGLMMNADKAKG